MTKLLHKELTGQLIGAYYDVYNAMGRNYPEYICENALMYEIGLRSIPCVRQDEHQIFYKGQLVGVQRLDILAAREVTIENKVCPQLTRLHKAQCISYMKTVGNQIGLLFNFGSPEPEFERLFFDRHQVDTQAEKGLAHASAQLANEDWLYPELAYTIVGGLFEVHNTLGPGFIHRIYANASFHELKLRGLEVLPRKSMEVYYKGVSVGRIKLGHIQVGDDVMVFPVAIQDINDLRFTSIKAWMMREGIKLGILANFYATTLEPVFLRV